MSARRILIVYATTHGQTAKVARRVADLLLGAGHAIALANADAPPRDLSLDDVDGIVVASPILFGRHRPAVARFVRDHRAALNAMPSAFVSVSGSAGSPLPAARMQAQRCVDAFLRETGWRPTRTELVGGAVAYTRYNPLLRWVMARISRKEGRPTDTSRDHELTDWTQVARFTEAFAKSLETAPKPRAALAS